MARKNELSPPLHSRAVGAYVGLAVGDALGATVEFMTPREIQAKYTCHQNVAGGGWLRLRAGQVTDDTTMSLYLGRAILDRGGVDADVAAQAFDAWMRGKPVDIGNTVRRGIVEYRRTGLTQRPVSEHDAGNGACMRCLPVALATFYRPLCRFEASRAQAHVTHNNPLSDAGTECVIEMVHGALSGKSLVELREGPVARLLREHPLFKFDGARCDNPSGYIVETLRAVFQALFTNDGYEAAMVDVVNRGGDADTTGAIVGMIAGGLYGVAAIPPRWLNALDEHVRGECETQARALIELGRLPAGISLPERG